MPYLTQELLAQIAARAPHYDQHNTFCVEDLADLQAAGYLAAPVPTSFGGGGLSLTEIANEQSRLAAVAPATALAVNMHVVWCSVAGVLHRRGDDSLARLLGEAAAGSVFAFGISEAGNDLMLFGSTTTATPDGEGGFSFTGTKIFTTLAPAWDRLGVHGLDPQGHLVFAFVTRDATTTRNDWDSLGMRATQSATTDLHGAHAPAHWVVRRLPAGPNADPFIVGIYACFEILVSAVYLGLGQRALDLAIESAQRRRTAAGTMRSEDPVVRYRIAHAAMGLDTARTVMTALAADVDTGVEHPNWFAKLSTLKVSAIAAARDAVDMAMIVTGGASYGNGSELSRLYRDVAAGIFHPSSDDSAHSVVATSLLGPLTPPAPQ